MKLPELKEKLKSKYIVRVVAGVLTRRITMQTRTRAYTSSQMQTAT